MYTIDGYKRMDVAPQHFEFTKPKDAWRFLGEQISCVPDVEYPWDPAIVKAIRAFEPEFVPFFVRSRYVSPTGGEYIFGRHGLAVAPRIPERRHQIIRPLMPSTTAGPRYPIVMNDILQDKTNRIVPELSVFGFMKFDWALYHKAKRSWWDLKHNESTQTAERDAADYQRESGDAALRVLQAQEAESDYKFDHETNKGKTIKSAFEAMSASDWANLGAPQDYKARPFIHTSSKGNA